MNAKKINLKLRLLALMILVVFLASSILEGAINVKFGTDSSNQDWSGITNSYIANSNGKAFPATGAGLQDAIWDLNGTAGSAYLPVGEIAIDKTIDLPGGIYLVGSGSNSENCTHLNANAGVLVVINLDGKTGSKHRYGGISNMYISGNKETKSVGINVTNGSLWAEIYDVTVYGFDFNIRQFDQTGLIIRKCKLYGSTSSGIDSNFSASNSGALQIYDCDFNPESGYSIYFNKSYHSLVSGCWFEYSVGNSGSHIYLDDSKGCKIVNNLFGANKDVDKYGIYMQSSPSVVIDGNVFYVDGYGIYTGFYCDRLIISNNVFHQGEEGIWMDSDSDGVCIDSNAFYNNGETSIYCESVYATITGNSVYTSGNFGIHVKNDRFSVIGNVVYDSTSHGIYVQAGRSSITGNVIHDCGGDGIQVGTSRDHNIISNNVIYSCDDNGVYIPASCHNNTIIGNVIESNTNDGIKFHADTNYSVLSNNVLTGNGGNAIEPNGKNIYMTNNIGFESFVPVINQTLNVQAGYMWFNCSDNKLWVYNGSAWVSTTLT